MSSSSVRERVAEGERLAAAGDTAAAFRQYKAAADQGSAEGLFKVGWCYEHGEGVGRDLDQAVGAYMKAHQQGHAASYDRLMEPDLRRIWQ